MPAKRLNPVADTEIFDDEDGFLRELEADIAAFMTEVRTHGFRLPTHNSREGQDDLAA